LKRVAARSDSLIDLETLERGLLDLITGRLLDSSVALDATSGLAEAGLDSMAIMQLLLLIEDSYGLWLPESDLSRTNFASVRALAGVLHKRLSERESGG
jgi:acyl carrier protein